MESVVVAAARRFEIKECISGVASARMRKRPPGWTHANLLGQQAEPVRDHGHGNQLYHTTRASTTCCMASQPSNDFYCERHYIGLL
jgi:hypothetical protein